jgi:hypothetical protein
MSSSPPLTFASLDLMSNCLRPSLNFWVQVTVMKSSLGLLLETSRKHVISTCFLTDLWFCVMSSMSRVAVTVKSGL